MTVAKALFFDLIQTNPAVAVNLARTIADHLAKMMREISSHRGKAGNRHDAGPPFETAAKAASSG